MTDNPLNPTELLAADGPERLVVIIDRGVCIGAGDCVAVAPRAFMIDEHRRICFVAPETEAVEALWEAARRCPTDAIMLETVTGDQLYP